jgi:hypothetical protein
VSSCRVCCDVAHAGGRGAVTYAAAREAALWPCSWVCGDAVSMAERGEGGDVAMQLRGVQYHGPCSWRGW